MSYTSCVLLLVVQSFALNSASWSTGYQNRSTSTITTVAQPSTASVCEDKSAFLATWTHGDNGTCENCCGFEAIPSTLWTWSSVTRTPIVVGTAIIVIDPNSNKTSTKTELHTVSITANVSHWGTTQTVFDPSSWWRNGTFVPKTLTTPKTAEFTGVNDKISTLTYPAAEIQYESTVSWWGQLQVTTNGTTSCVQENELLLPSPTGLEPPETSRDPQDPNGEWWVLDIYPHGKLWEGFIKEHFHGHLVESLYETCIQEASATAAPTAVDGAEFLLSTTTSYGTVADSETSRVPVETSPSEGALPSSPQETALPVTTAQTTADQPAHPSPTAVEVAPLPGDSAPEVSDSPSEVSAGPEEATNNEAGPDSQNAATNPPSQPEASSSRNIGGIIASVIGMLQETTSNPADSPAQQDAPASPTSAPDSNSPAVGDPPSAHDGSTDPAASDDNESTPASAEGAQTSPPSSNDEESAPSVAALPPIVLGSNTISADSSSGYAIGAQNLQPGGTITIGSGQEATTLALQTSGSSTQVVVNGIASPSSAIAAPILAPLVLDGSPVTPNAASEYIVGSQTLHPGGTITVSSGADATILALEASEAGLVAVVNGVTSQLSPAAPTTSSSPPGPSPPPLVIGSATVFPNAVGAYVVKGQNLHPGSSITLSGTTVALQTSSTHTFVVINGQTSALADAVPPTKPTSTASDSLVVIGTQTLTADGPEATISYSVLPGGSSVVIGGSTTEPIPTETGSSSDSPDASSSGESGCADKSPTSLLLCMASLSLLVMGL